MKHLFVISLLTLSGCSSIQTCGTREYSFEVPNTIPFLNGAFIKEYVLLEESAFKLHFIIFIVVFCLSASKTAKNSFHFFLKLFLF